MKYRIIICYPVFLCILLLSCSTAKTIYKQRNSKGNRVKIVNGDFRGCIYFKLTESRKGQKVSQFFVEFECQETGSIAINKSLYDDHGKYIQTRHAVSDTSGSLKIYGRDLISALQTKWVRNSFRPIASDELLDLKIIAREIGKQNNQFHLTDNHIYQIVGWVN